MSQSDQVVYLTRDPRKFDSRLRQMIEAAKIGRMPPEQWVSYINGLNSKGVKKDDIRDSGALDWLEGRKPDSPPAGKPVTKEQLVEALERYAVTIKEVVLGQPQYKGWHHGDAQTPYQEILFIANSERANIEDRLEEIEFEMESLGFDMSRLTEDPMLILRLEKERGELMSRAPSAVDFQWSHFKSNDISGKHGKNLIAHARVTIHDGLYFIEEIQSDWGQSGRVRRSVNESRRRSGLPEISWNDHVPKGPFVTDTKLWAGLVLRRLLQRAAMMPGIDRVAWIRIDMKNGHKVNPRPLAEARAAQREAEHAAAVQRAQERGEEPPAKPVDDHDHFYTRVIPSLADASIGKAGGKVAYVSETICGVQYDDIPGFKMTPEIRQVLKGVQPLYSAASVLRHPKPVTDERLARLVRNAKQMIGSSAHIRFVDRLYNLHDMTAVSGSYLNRIVDVALNSADIVKALDHECYHYAHDQLLSAGQRRVVLDAFKPGGELNAKVRDLLLRDNQPAAAAQCQNSEEAAAHGFAYWKSGRLNMASSPAQGVFEHVVRVVTDGLKWLRGLIQEQDLETAEDVFMAIRHGVLAEEREKEAVESGAASRPGSQVA